MECDEKYSEDVPVYRIVDQFIIDKEPLNLILDFIYQYENDPKVIESIFKHSSYIDNILKYPYVLQFNEKQLLKFLKFMDNSPIKKLFFYWRFLAVYDTQFKGLNNFILKDVKNLRGQKECCNISYPIATYDNNITKQFNNTIIGKIKGRNNDFDFILDLSNTKSIIRTSIFANYILSTDFFEYYVENDLRQFQILNNIFELLDPYNCGHMRHLVDMIKTFIVQMLDNPNVHDIYKAYIIETLTRNKDKVKFLELFDIEESILELLYASETYEQFMMTNLLYNRNIFSSDFLVYLMVTNMDWFKQLYMDFTSKIDNIININRLMEVENGNS